MKPPILRRGGQHQPVVHEYPQVLLSLDHTFVMTECLGPEAGLAEAALQALEPQLEAIREQIQVWRRENTYGFFDLPYDLELVKEIKRLVKKYKEWHRDVLVLGIGGSALGAKALQQALCHPAHNRLAIGRRQYHCRLFVADNIDPDDFYGMMDDLELKRTLVNVISKSGETPETMAQFILVYYLLGGRLGSEQTRQSFLLTTDPEKGSLRRLARQYGFDSLPIPDNVGGRFSVLSAVGLFPAAMAGVDIDGVLAGARFMDQHLQSAPLSQNLAFRLAALYYLAYQKGRSVQVLMPYAGSLAGVADWFCQLWAESLGKKTALDGSQVHTGPTPVRAMGVTDQHSQLQLFMEGPADKIITFLEVAKFKQDLTIPDSFPDLEGLSYLAGHSFGELLAAEQKATAFNLMKAGRPNLTIQLPEINAFSIGQLLYLLEVTTVVMGGLLQINPFDQPGVEAGKQTAGGLLGRPGYEKYKDEVASLDVPHKKYILGTR